MKFYSFPPSPNVRKVSAVFKNGIGYDPQKLYDDAKSKIIN